MFLSLAIAVSANPIADQYSVPSTARPVPMLKQPAAADIEFVAFRFQEPALYELSVHYGPIEGEPRIGEEYGVEVVIGGEEAIASFTLSAVDENRQLIQQVPVASTREYDDLRFVGLMTVPSRPFRIVMSGKSVDGQAFTRIYPHLFKPVSSPKPVSQFPPETPREMAAAFDQMLDQLAPQTVAERQALVAGNPGGVVAIPRMRVSDVAYAPLLTAGGRAIGMRVTYNAAFSARGQYRAGVSVFPREKGDILIGVNPLIITNSKITPVPGELQGTEYERMSRTNQIPTFLYEADTLYRFEVELVPNFIGFERAMVPCFAGKNLEKWNGQDRLARRLTADEPATYMMSIPGAGLEGSLENFYSEKTFYESFIGEGLRDCNQ